MITVSPLPGKYEAGGWEKGPPFPDAALWLDGSQDTESQTSLPSALAHLGKRLLPLRKEPRARDCTKAQKLIIRTVAERSQDSYSVVRKESTRDTFIATRLKGPQPRSAALDGIRETVRGLGVRLEM